MKAGITEDIIYNFGEKYGWYLPKIFQDWLTLYNGGEIFALPIGTTIAGMLGDKEREKGVFLHRGQF